MGKHLQADAVEWHSLCGLQWHWLLFYAHMAPLVHHIERFSSLCESCTLVSPHIQCYHGF